MRPPGSFNGPEGRSALIAPAGLIGAAIGVLDQGGGPAATPPTPLPPAFADTYASSSASRNSLHRSHGLAKALRSGIRLVESFLTGLSCSQQNFPQSIPGLPIWRHERRLVLNKWLKSCELAIAFGWKPSFAGAKRHPYILIKYPLDVPSEDALSFSQAIARCLTMLLNKQKLGRKQMAAILLSSKEPGVFDACHHDCSFGVFLRARAVQD
jgi:hypothetical protein